MDWKGETRVGYGSKTGVAWGFQNRFGIWMGVGERGGQSLSSIYLTIIQKSVTIGLNIRE